MNLRCHRTSERGSTILEAGVIFTTFFALLIGIVDVGQVLFQHQTLSERARAAARWGAVRPLTAANRTAMQNIVLYATPSTPKEDRVSNTLFGLTPDNVLVEQIGNAGASAGRIAVHIKNYPFRFLAPFLAGKWTGREILVSVSSELPD